MDKHRSREKYTKYFASIYCLRINFYYFKESETLNATNIPAEKKADEPLEDADEDEDISTALEKEINELRMEREMPLPSRRFQVYLCHIIVGLTFARKLYFL